MGRTIEEGDDVTELKGVGESIGRALRARGVETVGDAARAAPAELVDGTTVRNAVAAKVSGRAREAVVSHVVSGAGGRYSCGDCDFETTDPSEAAAHVREHNDGLPGSVRPLITDGRG